ncbi:sensor histidine kinase [Streptomyces hoynatensis]|uniref:histidine kinase n=1 Tax=Streptomyces hoynatensis TaxID=1141874 RepID=A0A3A9Z691_9ACTN|nr:sensor histidine kinase [Streptomyces hoynatensis]RKN43891.1 sensor histidine kinase [Streptomyces hoynatensis]
MDATRNAPLAGLWHRLGPALGWTTAAFLLTGPHVQLLAVACLDYRNGLAPLIPFALPAAVAVTLLLRRFPLPALALLLTSALLPALLSFPPDALRGVSGNELVFEEIGPAALALCHIAAARPPRTVLAAAGLVCATLAGFETLRLCQGVALADTRGQLEVAGQFAFALLVGHTIQQRRVSAEEARARATERAITAERLRIARELHDMVAHSVGIIAIQAGVGNRVIETQPAEARAALRAIEATSRETLSGLRRTLVALRRGEPADGREQQPPDAPAPGLADLERLAAGARDGGVLVAVRTRGEPRPLPPDLDLAAYRIVQEAVTNVVRHAGTESCQVTVDYGSEDLGLEIVDAGRGVPGRLREGFGLTGMRERVGLLHGEFSAGPRPLGGFRVAASLPLAERAGALAAR